MRGTHSSTGCRRTHANSRSAPRPKKTDRAEPKARECGECGAVLARAATACTECGTTSEGELVELDSEGELVELDAALHARKVARWDELIDNWHSHNGARIGIGGQPMKRGWIAMQFLKEFGCRPPRGCKLPHDMASDEEKSAALQQLQQTAAERGYKAGWAFHRFRERFGHFPARRRVSEACGP